MSGLKLRDKRLVLPVVLVAAVATTVLWSVLRTDPASQRMCWSLLSKNSAAQLRTDGGSGLHAEEMSALPAAEGQLAHDGPICLVSPEENSGVLLFGLGIRTALSDEPAPRDAAPIGGGLTGWVGPQWSWVRLPEKCSFPMGGGGAGVLLELKIDPAAGPQRAEAARTALLESARNLTRTYRCTDSSFDHLPEGTRT
ncbi:MULTISPECIES: hypothetical protein [unclassified Streptomyces]|uniref:hypothetical protein n=1 Tax=unclassified Streptomyces TaxID=2593676 RepID=UPI002E2BB552|nr:MULTISPECIES: hypothetical protein [unclassified Streptomyces]